MGQRNWKNEKHWRNALTFESCYSPCFLIFIDLFHTNSTRRIGGKMDARNARHSRVSRGSSGISEKGKGRKAGFRKSRNLQIQEEHGKNTGISEIGKRKNTGISQKRYRKLFRYKTQQPCETAGSPKRKKAGISHKQESQPFFRKTAKKMGFCTGENGDPCMERQVSSV